MSYAIEVKKRKFERILESLTDSTPPPTRASLNSRNNASAASDPASTTSDQTKRRRITPTSILNLNNASTTSLSAHYLPSSRTAFLDRLETYRNVTKWHIPSTSTINAAEWAKRGWICQDTDTVSCPSCKETIYVNLDVQEQPRGEENEHPSTENGEEEIDALSLVNAVYEALIKRYQGMIVDSHKDRCPWKRRGCDSSIQRIEGLLNVTSTISGLESRYDTIIGIEDIPKVAALPSSQSDVVEGPEMNALTLQRHMKLDQNAVILATCGWQKKDADVVECRHCFRSLGLWLYRGDDPTMEHLDAIDSHLEYCPWRSSQSQDTEVMTGKDHAKRKIPGWLLVYMAIVKDNQRRRGTQPRPTTPLPRDIVENSTDAESQMSPEEREKKLKDLFRRIRDIRKPFNVKSLLKKKTKPETVRR